jgi:hypothetical protein
MRRRKSIDFKEGTRIHLKEKGTKPFEFEELKYQEEYNFIKHKQRPRRWCCREEIKGQAFEKDLEIIH